MTIKRHDILTFLFFIILPLTSMLSFARYILLGSIVILFVFCISNNTIRRELINFDLNKNSFSYVNILFLTQYIWYIIILIINGIGESGVLRIIQLLGCQLAINFGRMAGESKFGLTHIRRIIRMIMLIGLISWILMGHPMQNYCFIFLNANSLGTIALIWLIILFGDDDKSITRPINILFFFIGIILIIVSGARTALIAIIVFYSIVNCGKISFASEKLIKNKLLFLTFTSLSLAFIIVYPKMISSDLGNQLQDLSRIYTHKNFFSGREDIWEYIIDMIKERPIFGYGLSEIPSQYLGFNYSSHNSYLQIAFQSGIIGVVLLLLTLKNAYNNCIETLDTDSSMRSIAIIMVVIIHENFEICITQNMLVMGLQFWYLIGFGCNYSTSKNEYEGTIR